jgi:enoyl-CoA hydratase/carnithine racemase
MRPTYWQRQGSVAVLHLADGENRHNPESLASLLADLDAIEADAAVQALVIVSDDAKNWSLGIDLAWLQAQSHDPAGEAATRAFLYDINRLFARVLTFPVPVVAALTGHAFGNGAILACACDFRVMRSDRGFFCFPEVDVHIPLLPGMFEIVAKALPMHLLESLYFSGRRSQAAELATHHVVSATAEGAEATLAAALQLAAGFAKGRGIFGEMKRRKHAPILEVFEQRDAPLIERLALTA